MKHNVKSNSRGTLNSCADIQTHTQTQWGAESHMTHTKPMAVARAYQMKEEIKKCLRTQMYPLLHYFNFVSVWSVRALTRHFILFQIFVGFYFLSAFKWWAVLFFFSMQVNYTKEVFDLWNPICISRIVSSSYCGILKVRSERPFDNYRKTFWLYYTAFYILSGRG